MRSCLAALDRDPEAFETGSEADRSRGATSRFPLDSGLMTATTIGLFAADATHVAGRLVSLLRPGPQFAQRYRFCLLRPPAFAGYHAALGVAQIRAGWRHAVAIAGAVTVAAVAATRIGQSGFRNSERGDE